ncbi:MAG: hypothetical protein JWM12_2303, partial [Ilumatobacteraceae bacterium]|nr:hypothetical protein [Ilumatobacteraceae bacterium]
MSSAAPKTNGTNPPYASPEWRWTSAEMFGKSHKRDRDRADEETGQECIE